MAGSEPGYGHGGGSHDLLRKATQAMMSSKSGEEDVNDNNDSDTPRSGVATPRPDPSDKRLPGIVHSYFQVGPDFGSSETSISVPLETPTLGTESLDPAPLHKREETELGAPQSATGSVSDEASCDDGEECASLLPHERTERRYSSPDDKLSPNPNPNFDPYPTPPVSKPPSVQALKFNDSIAEDGGAEKENTPPTSHISFVHHKTSSVSLLPKAGSTFLLKTLSNIVTTSNVHAAHFSNPSDPDLSNLPNTPIHSRIDSDSLEDSVSYDRLKRLTIGDEKSQSPTPTRALSNNTATSDTSETGNGLGRRKVADVTESKASSPDANGATLKPPRGKLTVKIVEARGLRRSKDPYVVAVFQRNELVSKGPRSEDTEDDDEEAAKSPIGGIPISRQGSDSGRPMAIPMKSRQSSSTSLTDYRDFKIKTRRSMTSPKWDTEAVFDVVGDESRVNITIYDRGSVAEDFLGYVEFIPELSEYTPSIKGWYPLRSRKDTQAPASGEVYVEVSFQRTEKRHYGPEDFQILKLIGKGTFGQVYQVRKKDTRRIYAMKVLQKKVIVQKKEVAHTVGERNILVRTAMTDSPFIVGLKFSFQTPTDLYLVTDYMSGGELFWHLQKEGRFDEKRAKFYIAELILALQHLHVHDIVYRDLKPENILLDANGHIALCDFGLSKANLTKNDTTNTFCGTTEYLAPEVLLDEAGYTKMVDFWSLGVLVFEMCCGWSPFYAEDTQQMYKNIAFGKVRFPRDTLSTEGRNFVKGLLNRNPKHRLGATDDAEELMRHPFFADIDWEALTKKLITPPFKPKLKSETDTSNFDPEFTNALNGASSLNARAAALAAGVATSTPLSPGMQANFKGFTFVDESSIDDHFRDNIKFDYDEMDEDEKREQDWEDPFDIPGEGGDDGMSDLVKSHTHEDSSMINGEHFDL